MRLALLIILPCLAVCASSWAQNQQQPPTTDATTCPRVSDIQDKAVLERYQRLKELFPQPTAEWQVVASNLPKPQISGLCRGDEISSEISKTYQDRSDFKITVIYTPVIGPGFRAGFEKFTSGKPGTLMDSGGNMRRTYSATILGRPAELTEFVFDGTDNVENVTLMPNHMQVMVQFEPTQALTLEEIKQRLFAFASTLNYAAFDDLPSLPADLP
jgi:hypothetical protein